MEIPLNVTIRAKYEPAMSIKDQAEADAYFEACVEHSMHWQRIRGQPLNRQEAESIERQNLGYYAGYYDDDTRERVERLYHCAHPVFGTIAENGPPREALRKGIEMGKSLKRLHDK